MYSSENDRLKFKYNFNARFWIFVGVSALCLLVTSLIAVMLQSKAGTTAGIRVLTVVQDLGMFILPPIITAVLISWLPASYLEIDRGFSPRLFLLALVAYTVSIPGMNYLVEWNKSLELPEFMAAYEQQMKNMESMAEAAIRLLIGEYNGGSFLISVLIVGFLAGFSEELFFRAGLQRLLVTAPINRHVAIWITAFVFSAIHFQFYGFVPRLLLGAFFGYLYVWSGSIWLPIFMHALNNTLVVISDFYSATVGHSRFDTIGTEPGTYETLMVITSVLCTVILLWIMNVKANSVKKSNN